MELCHARYNFECISYIHKWLQHVLVDYASRTSDEQFKVGLSFLPSSITDVLIDRRVAIA